MAKRVYELAKEIGVDNTSLMQFLKDNNIAVKSHMSNLDDDAIAKVQSDFKKPVMKAAPQHKVSAEEEKAPERPKKKASITAVFNPQNSKNMKDRKPAQKRQTGERQARPAGERPTRPAGERPVRPAGERPVRPAGERPARPAGERPAKPAGERPAKPTGERPARPLGDRMMGERPTLRLTGERVNVERPTRSNNDRGTRPARANDNRPNRGDGNDKNERMDRRDRKDGQNYRGGSNYNQGDRGNNRFGGNRQEKSGGQRFDRELNKFNKDSAKAAPDEVRTKESRDNNRKKNNSNNNTKKDYDKLGSKKQERFVNLEKQTGHKKRNAIPQQPAAKE